MEDSKENKELSIRKQIAKNIKVEVDGITYAALGVIAGIAISNNQPAKQSTANPNDKVLQITEYCVLQAQKMHYDLRNEDDAQKFKDLLFQNFEANGIHINKEKTAHFLDVIKDLHAIAPPNSQTKILDTVQATKDNGTNLTN